MDVEGKTAIVTGGGSGLGAETARQLAASGARVVIVDLNKAVANDLAREIGAEVRLLDVADAAAGEAFIVEVTESIGVPRILVNCAGVGTPAKILGKDGPLPLAVFERIVRVNLVGTFNMTRLVAHAIATGGPAQDKTGTNGVIVNTASIAAFDGQIGQPAYASSKAGVVGLTLPAARELARYGIRVLTIAPGLFETPMLELLPDEARQALAASIPFPPRLGTAAEFASLALHLIGNDMMNGETIRIDGANRLPPR